MLSRGDILPLIGGLQKVQLSTLDGKVEIENIEEQKIKTFFNKKIEDFYPDNCDFIEIDSEISNGKSFGVCKNPSLNSITSLINADSGGAISIDIPHTVLYSLASTDLS